MAIKIQNSTIIDDSRNIVNAGVTTVLVNSSSDALRITQTGAGNALVVEDETNPDSTPFVVNASGSVGIGTTNATEALTLSGKIQINQNSTSDNRLIFRGQPGSSYRWNIDNYGSSNELRMFREDDATSANGSVAVSISTTGTVTATKFSGDGSLLTGITAAGSGVVVQNQGSTVGTAGTLNFSTNLTASFASGAATISLSNNPSISGILTADQVYTSNNGNGTNIRIGDDLWIGDINVANTIRFSGAQDSTKAFVVFGSSDAVALGRTGTGPLYYGGNLDVAGVVTASSFSGNASSATYATSAGISTNVIGGIGSLTQLQVTGVSTFTNGPVLVGSATSTGTASQPLQVTGGAYVSGNTGIGTTNPRGKLDVVGLTTTTDLYVAGVGTFLSSGLKIRNPANTFQYNITGAVIAADRTLNLPAITGTDTLAALNVSSTWTSNQTFSGTLSATSTVSLSGSGTGAHNFGTNQTSATLTFGGTSGTGTITLGRATTSQQTDIQAGASGVGTTKTINFGTGGLANSNTIINIGPTAGVGTVSINTGTNLGIGSATPTSKLDVVGDAKVSGVVTATSFSGNASSATYATTAGVATALQNSRTFEITGDIIASPISFDGTGNVSLAATIQPNSVALGSDTTGDYVQSITGTSNQITVTGGTGEGSTPTLSIPSQFTAPQDVTVTRDLQVNRNLNVNGNITIGGTAATLFTTEFKVYDPDIVLGFRTDGSGNDVSTDTTANHGGIAIASTEGTPLIQLYDVGIGETNPATYKKIMWFKSGTFTGLGTDAWLSNYAIGIGSTQVPNGVRLAAGGMQVTDNTISSPQLNISGVTTSTGGFVGNLTGTATTATNLADAANITTGTINSARLSGTYDINVSYATTAGIATVAQGLTGTPNITVGVVTATSFVKSGGTSSQFLKADGSVDSSTYLTSYTETDTLNSVTGRGNSTDNGISVGILTATSGNFSGIFTSSGAVISGVSTISVNSSTDALRITQLGSGNALVVEDSANPDATPFVVTGTGSVGIGTTNPTQILHIQGNARITGGIYDSNNNVGTAGSVLSSTGTGLSWIPAASGGGGAGTTFFGAKFDTNIDSTLYIQPTGTLDIVGVGTTTTQITTFPAGSSEYIIHSIHVTNISNGDAEITGGFLINSRAVPASISVSIGQSGRAGFNTVTVGSASSIVPGMAVIGTGNIGETTGIGSTAGFQFNTYVTSVDGNVVSFSKPLSGRIVGVATFIPTSKFASRLPVPVGSAVELLKQPMILNALDSIVLQSTGAGTGVGSTSTAAISQTSGSNLLTVTAGAAITNFIAAGQLIQGTGSNTGIQTNTFVGVGYTPGQLIVPMTRPATSTLASQILSFTEVVTPQDGALQATIVYQTTADTSFQGGTGTVVGIVTLASQATPPTLGITSTVPLCYYGTGNTFPSTIQSIRVTNISDGSIYPGGDYPVWVGIGNSDTVFSWLAYNMIIPKNSSIELCEAPKRLGIGQSIFAYSNTPGVIEIQVAARQRTS